jgi:hypothetical protein
MTLFAGWRLVPTARDELLRRFPPIYPVVRADHVTCDVNWPVDQPEPPIATIALYGMLTTAHFQIAAVSVGREIFQPRRDRLYHITISRQDGVSSGEAGKILFTATHLIQPVPAMIINAMPFVEPMA